MKKEVLSIFIILLISIISISVYALDLGADNEVEQDLEPIDPNDYLDDDKQVVLTEDATGTISNLDSGQSYYNTEGQGFTGYSGEVEIENGLVTGGIFSAEANPSLLSINNDFGFDLTYEMYEGDTLTVTDSSPNGLELDYLMNQLAEGISALINYTNGATQEFNAMEDDSLFLIYEDGKFEITDGLLTFESENLTQSIYL